MLLSMQTALKFFKMHLYIHVQMHKLGEDGEKTVEELIPFRGRGLCVTREMEGLDEELHSVLQDVEDAVEEFLFQGSGWVAGRPIFMEVELAKCQPMGGRRGCGPHIVEWVREKGLLPKNLEYWEGGEEEEEGRVDGECFYYAVAAHFHNVDTSPHELKDFIERKMVKLSGEGPVRVSDIEQFEKKNPLLNLAVNVVYCDEEGDILPLRAAKKPSALNNIVLMLFHTCDDVREEGEKEEEEKDGSHQHYALVNNPETTLATRVKDSKGKRRSIPVFICYNCLSICRTKGAYESHVDFCHEETGQKIQMPRKGEVKTFDNVKHLLGKSFQSAYTVFYDFEALQVTPKKTCSCSEEVMKNTRLAAEEKAEWDRMTEDELAEYAIDELMLEGELTNRWETAKFNAQLKGRKGPSEPQKLRRPRPRKVCHHKTHTVAEQPPFAFSFILVDREGAVRSKGQYVGLDAADKFIERMLDLADEYLPSLSPGLPMEPLTAVEESIMVDAVYCYLCRKKLKEDRVRDHDHLTGKFLGPAHDECNLRRREQCRLTLFAHNFTGYDSHFLIRSLNRFPHRIHEVQAMPQNTQKFKTIQVNRRMVFLDSFAFLSQSLAKLVETLEHSKCDFPILRQLFPKEEERALLLRKGVYPYSFATSVDRLEKCQQLPERALFYSDLSGQDCSEEDYRHASLVWDKFDCKNMLEYTTLYMNSDVYLLAEVVFNFRNMVWSTFGLDVCRYVSLPQLAFDIMLKETEVRLELITDLGISKMFKENIRGGHSFVNLRHYKASAVDEAGEEEERRKAEVENAQSILRDADKDCLLYVDANNLYGSAMSLPLPLKDFRWMTAEEVANFDVEKCVNFEDGPGYTLEVDLEYPEELHLAHSSFPLAPENQDIHWKDLSPYSQEAAAALMRKRSHKSRKLTSTFRTRYKYVVSGANLKLYLSLGMRLLRIRRGVTYWQERYLEPFIRKCTEMRQKAATKAEQDMWKLICNSVYGKVRRENNKTKYSPNYASLSFSLSLSLLRAVHRVAGEEDVLPLRDYRAEGELQQHVSPVQGAADRGRDVQHRLPKAQVPTNEAVLGSRLHGAGAFQIHHAGSFLQHHQAGFWGGECSGGDV